MSDGQKTQLGKILLKQKLVNSKELETLLDEQKQDHERLASKVLEKGLSDEVKLLRALSEQAGVPATNLDDVEVVLGQLDIVPKDIALKHLILPFSVTHDSIHLAMANPDDHRVVDELEFVTGKKVFPHVALHAQISAAIDACYSAKERGESVYRGKSFGRPSAVGVSPSKDRAIDPATAGGVIADGPDLPDDDVEIDVDLEAPLDEVVGVGMPSVQAESSLGPVPVAVSPAAAVPKPVRAPAPAAAQTVADKSAFRILVVDDEDDIRVLISRVLVEKGYQVITAARGLEAIHKVQNETPDMVILDAMLPEVHGFDICKRIKGSAKYGHITVIMISAIYRGWRYAQDLKDSYGVDDFVEKPFKISDLVEKVERYSRTSVSGAPQQKEDLSKEAERILAAGIAAYRANEIDKAIELLRKGISIDPLAFSLHYHLGLLLGKKGLSYQAIRELENALELAPDHFPALKNLAVLYQKTGFKFKAIETWERSLGHCPDERAREGIKQHLVSLL
ncbi:MAG: response regulator [Deltaproteobacteria bacterium]|nr:response regulator [Deltaproteobacteria bacterium]